MAITSRQAVGVMNRPDRCQASLLWLRQRSTIPQTCEHRGYPPKGLGVQKADIRRSALHCQGLFAYRTNPRK
jgi:hypothetical protein